MGCRYPLLKYSQEFEYAIGLLQAELRVRESKFSQIQGDLQKKLSTILEIAKNTRSYLACLSEHGDSLAQWRAYARTGFCVGIETQELLKRLPAPSMETVLLRCEYDRIYKLDHVRESLERYAHAFAQTISDTPESAAALKEIDLDFYSHVSLMGTFFKLWSRAHRPMICSGLESMRSNRSTIAQSSA